MYRHVNGVTEAAVASRVDLVGVDVGKGAETDRPADCVDEHHCNGRIGRAPIYMLCRGSRGTEGRGPEDSHVDGHVDMGNELEGEAGDDGEATTKSVNQDPGEDHGEDEFDDSVGAGGYEGDVTTRHPGVGEDLC